MKEGLSEQRKFFSRIGLAYFIGSLVIYGVQLGAGALVRSLWPEILENYNWNLLLSMMTMYLIGMPIMAAVIGRIPKAGTPAAGGRMTVPQFLCAFCIAYALMYLSNLVGMALTSGISVLKGSPVNNDLMDIVLSGNTALLFFLTAFCAPIWEETLFRKLLIDRVSRYGEGVSVLLSGLLFGFFHGNLSQFVYAFSLGLLLGFLYVRTRRVRYTILLHVMINSVSVAASALLKWSGLDRILLSGQNDGAAETLGALLQNGLGLMAVGLYSCLVMALVLTGVILLLVNLKRFNLRDTGEAIPRGRGFATVIGNPGMLLFLIFWLFMMVRQLME